MKRIIIFILIFLVCLVSLSSEEQGLYPSSSISLILVDSFAFVGVSLEGFWFERFGLGLTFTGFIIGVDNSQVFLYEPGAYARWYISKTNQTSVYLGSAVRYLGAGGDIETIDIGVLVFAGFLGINSPVGRNSRFFIEAGLNRNEFVVEDTTSPAWYFMHFSLGFGMLFY